MTAKKYTTGNEPVDDPWEGEGGRAFPAQTADDYYPGMSMRDWFAGRAMQQLLSFGDSAEEQIAKQSYKIADAMLAERNREG